MGGSAKNSLDSGLQTLNKNWTQGTNTLNNNWNAANTNDANEWDKAQGVETNTQADEGKTAAGLAGQQAAASQAASQQAASAAQATANQQIQQNNANTQFGQQNDLEQALLNAKKPKGTTIYGGQ